MRVVSSSGEEYILGEGDLFYNADAGAYEFSIEFIDPYDSVSVFAIISSTHEFPDTIGEYNGNLGKLTEITFEVEP